jgi:hypothetical protein
VLYTKRRNPDLRRAAATRLDLPDPDGPEMMKTMLIAAVVALEADFTGGWRRAQEIAKLTLPHRWLS